MSSIMVVKNAGSAAKAAYVSNKILATKELYIRVGGN